MALVVALLSVVEKKGSDLLPRRARGGGEAGSRLRASGRSFLQFSSGGGGLQRQLHTSSGRQQWWRWLGEGKMGRKAKVPGAARF
jgi:hypothetical protein